MDEQEVQLNEIEASIRVARFKLAHARADQARLMLSEEVHEMLVLDLELRLARADTYIAACEAAAQVEAGSLSEETYDELVAEHAEARRLQTEHVEKMQTVLGPIASQIDELESELDSLRALELLFSNDRPVIRVQRYT
jgi:hypothetical protein